MRTLVVHYSRTGTTRALAHQLADALGADLEELRDPTPRRGLGGWLRCAMQARRGTLVPLAPLRHDPAAFDLVVVGTPIWAGAVSSPVRTFLHHHRSHLRGLACFCTGGGESGDEVLAQLERLAGHDARAHLFVRASEAASAVTTRKIAAFVERLGAQEREILTPPPSAPRQDDAAARRH